MNPCCPTHCDLPSSLSNRLVLIQHSLEDEAWKPSFCPFLHRSTQKRNSYSIQEPGNVSQNLTNLCQQLPNAPRISGSSCGACFEKNSSLSWSEIEVLDIGFCSMIFFSYVKMHFSYVKSNIIRKWLNMLRNCLHARTFFTPKIHPPPITLPATRQAEFLYRFRSALICSRLHKRIREGSSWLQNHIR